MSKSKRPQRRFLKSLLPKRKRERRQVELLGGVSVTLLTVLIVGTFFASSLQQYALRSSSVGAVIAAILVDLANTDRSARGLETLTMDPTLVAVAQAKANDMASKGYFSHISPEGLDPWHWFKTIGYEYSFAGENLAIDFSDSGAVERAWMNSPTHRDNILNSKFTKIGIATAQGTYQGRTTTFVVQVFAQPSDTAPAFAGVVEETTPEDPTETAIASAPSTEEGDVLVLGSETTEEDVAPAASKVPEPALTEPVLAATLAEEVSGDVPLWGYIVGFPKDALQYAYYILGLLILLALAIETGLEIRSHHRKKAMRAGLLLVVMVGLFIVADYSFFAEPVLAQTF